MDKQLNECLENERKEFQDMQEKIGYKIVNLENQVRTLERNNKSIQEILLAIVFLVVIFFICVVKLCQ